MEVKFLDFDNEINCQTCKHGYDNGSSWDGLHEMCGAHKCYMCAERDGHCSSYEQGDIPEGKERI